MGSQPPLRLSSALTAPARESSFAYYASVSNQPGGKQPDLPQELEEHRLSEAMRSAGIHPSLIYAFQKTGIIVTQTNRRRWTKTQMAGWNAAIAEYERRRARGEADPVP